MYVDRGPRDSKPSARWRTVGKEIMDMVKRGSCSRGRPGSTVAPEYITEEAIDQAETIVYTVAKDGKVNAFALVRWRRGHMDTLVVCSEKARGGSAKPVVLESLMLARKAGKPYAELHALRNVLTWYPRFGYALTAPMSEGNDIRGWHMRKNLSDTVNWRELPPGVPRHGSVAPESPATPVAVAKPMATEYPVDSVVWASVPPYPWWPAQIQTPQTAAQRKLPHHPGDVFVVFYGTGDFRWISPDRLRPYASPPQQKKRSAALLRAIQAADNSLL